MDAARGEPQVPGHVDHAAMAVIQLAAMSPHEVSAVLDEAALLVRTESLTSAAPIAMTGGALVENGAPAEALAKALLERIPEVLSKAHDFAMAVDALDQSGPGDLAVGTWVGDRFAPDAWVQDRYQSHRDEVVAWHELRRFCLPLIAATTHDRVALNRLTLRPPGAPLDFLRHVEPHARFLYILSRILLDAPLRFLDTESGRVFDLRVDAVPTNFELHTLLIGALSEPLRLPEPDPEVLVCVRGSGPRQHLTPSRGAWALYTANAFPALIAGMKVSMDDWVWNESIPSEIPEVDGVRVLVAGVPNFDREWETGRTF